MPVSDPAAAPPVSLGDRLTVVLLTYNCAHRIAWIVERLLELDVPIVAVDNASSDGTAAVLREYAGVDLIELARNTGAAGRNVGALHARTPYVAFCDDDGWYERDGLEVACDLFDAHPRLGLINARILVRDEQRLDPISAEMADSPVPERAGVPGAVLLSFMAGAAVMRVSAYRAAGGYDERFFMGGEEETLAFPLAKLGWQMRYVPDVVMHHHPSLANATKLRAHGMRNTLVNAWLHRPLRSALRWTAFTLADTPKNRDYVRGMALSLRAIGWILRERAPMNAALDADVALLDARRYAARRPLLHRQAWRPEQPAPAAPNTSLTQPGEIGDATQAVRPTPVTQAVRLTQTQQAEQTIESERARLTTSTGSVTEKVDVETAVWRRTGVKVDVRRQAGGDGDTKTAP